MSALKFEFAQFIMTSNVLTVTDENHERCIFPILPVNVAQSYSLSMIVLFLMQKEHVQRDGDTWTGMFMFNFEFFLILKKNGPWVEFL